MKSNGCRNRIVKFSLPLVLLVACIFSLGWSTVFSRPVSAVHYCYTYETNCEPGLDLSGGSLVQGTMGYHMVDKNGNIKNDGEYIQPYMHLRITTYKHHSLGCYTNTRGQGYLIRKVYSAVFEAPDGSKVYASYPGGSFRLPGDYYGAINGVTIKFNSISKYKLKANTYYTLSGSYDRKHICSIDYDAPVKATSVYYERTDEWTINGQSYAGNQGRVNGNNSNAKDRKQGWNAIQKMRPGDRLYWDHDLRNSSNDDMSTDVTINIDNAVYLLDNGEQLSFDSNPSGIKKHGKADELFYVYHNGAGRKITQNDVGHRLCQRIAWQKKAWNDNGWGTSSWACATIPYHYPGRQGTNEPSNQFSDCTQTGTCPNTTPKGGIQLSTSVAGGQTTIMPGESVKFNYTLSNSGPTKSKGLTYRAYTFILKGGTGLPSNSNHMSTYPAGWQNVDCNSTNVSSGNHGTCLMGKNGSGLVIDPSTPKSITSDSYTIANEWLGNPGDQICSYIAVDNNWSVYNDTPANSYAVSNVACVKIGKKPQIQINGSDSYAKNGFTGGNYTDIAINTNRGSYSQYGLLTGSNGSITNFGTAGYTNISNTNKTKACKLAYANTTGLTNTNCSLLGKAGINRTISIPTKMNAGNVVSTELNVGDVGAGGSNLGNAYYRANGDLEIHGTLKEGNRITVYVDGNVTITDNIDTVNGETGRYDALSQIPSLTLVAAGDIRISSNVTLVNANLVAMNGSLHTCYNATNEDLGLVSKCSNKLKINGAVISKNSPKLLRTFGSGNISNYTSQWDANTTSSTSEWFNYTPNSWLVPNVGSMNSAITGYNTVSISDLPARY